MNDLSYGDTCEIPYYLTSHYIMIQFMQFSQSIQHHQSNQTDTLSELITLEDRKSVIFWNVSFSGWAKTFLTHVLCMDTI